MKNSAEFISIFNKLEKYFKDQVDDGARKPFYSLIGKLRHSNSNVRYYYVQLKEYADLRNAIVHERIDGRVIAEPNEYAIRELQTIYEKITSSPKVIVVCPHSVKTMQISDKLSEALGLMNKHGFSQVPIYNKETYAGMLNSIAISSWMSEVMSGGLVDISKIMIKDVLKYARKSRVTLFKSKELNVFDVLDVYKAYAILPDRIDAVIITETGSESEVPITIITDHDMLKIMDNV
ncbi:MAG: hypothetical protein WBA54_03995 [Acidaminobacteraceae bacterium]